MNEGEIPNGTKYLLVTRLLSDGANINNHNIDAVYILDVPDPLLKRQFIGRFRKGVKSIYEFINANKDYRKSVFNIKEEEQKYLKTLRSLKEIKFSKTVHAEKKKNKNAEDIYYDSNTGQYVISREYVRYYLLSQFNNYVLQNNPGRLMEYYESIANFEAATERFESWKYSNKDLIEKKEFLISIPDNLECIQWNKEEFIDNFQELLTAYILLKQSFELQKNSHLWDILSRDFDILSYYKDNKQYFNSRGCIDRIFNKILKFISAGYSYDFIIQLVEKLFDSQQSSFVDDLYKKISFYIVALNYREEEGKLKTTTPPMDEKHKIQNPNRDIVENENPELPDRYPIQSNSIKEISLVRYILDSFNPGDNFNYTNARKEFADYYESKWGKLGISDPQFRFLMESIFDYTNNSKRKVNGSTLRNSKKVPHFQKFRNLLHKEGINYTRHMELTNLRYKLQQINRDKMISKELNYAFNARD